ncbi:MAG: sialate O-acetylesterase [Planctomycetota bacterium]
MIRRFVTLFGFAMLLSTAAVAKPAEAVPVADKTAPAEGLDIYLLIGQSNMAGRAKVTADLAGPIDHAYLLNDKREWVPAKNPLNLYSTIRKGEGMQKLGPGYRFAVEMLQANPKTRIGLVVNARGGSKIEQWERGAKYYKELLERAEQAKQAGTLKGVLWHQGESNSNKPEAYLDQLKALIANLREDLGDRKLPFVAGQVTNTPPLKINDVIGGLPEAVPNTAAVSSEGLRCYDRWHFDTKSQLELGKRYAKAMLELQAAIEADQADDASN